MGESQWPTYGKKWGKHRAPFRHRLAPFTTGYDRSSWTLNFFGSYWAQGATDKLYSLII